MTTLAQLALRVARLATDVTDGIATAGDTISLTDTVRLTQQADWWNKGTAWILSGTYAGATRIVDDFATNRLAFTSTFPTVLARLQVETVTVLGSVTGSGNAGVIVDATGAPFSKSVSFAVLAGDTASDVGGKARTALGLDADVIARFTVGGAGAVITLTCKNVAANDVNLNLRITNVSCTGLTEIATSVNATSGIAGPAYAVSRGIYPWEQIVAAINGALNDTFIVSRIATALAPTQGDGITTRFQLPADSQKIVGVEIYDPITLNTYPSHHWQEEQDANGDPWVVFADGYPPRNGAQIHVDLRTDHPILSLGTDVISSQINDEWLRWKSTEYLLYWGVRQYGDAAQYRIEELLNRTLGKLKGLYPRKPLVIVQTAGTGGW